MFLCDLAVQLWWYFLHGVPDLLSTDQQQLNDIIRPRILLQSRIQYKYTIFDLLDLFFILELLDFEFFTYILLCLCVKVVLECLISRGRLNGTPGRSRKVRSLFFCLCIYLSSFRTDGRFPSNCDSSVPLAQTSNQSIARQQCNGFKPVG